MIRTTITLALTLALLPAALSAQSGQAAGQATGAAQARAGGEARIQTTFEQALSAGVPVSLLESKIAEGHAKGVDMDRIAAVVESRLEVLVRAQEAIQARGSVVSAAELAAAANALDAGARADAVQRVHVSAPEEHRAAALSLFAELIASGQLPEQALVGVQNALTHRTDALLRFTTGEGGNAGAAASVRSGARVQTGSAAEAAARARATLRVGGGN
jgi:hypothetical protein